MQWPEPSKVATHEVSPSRDKCLFEFPDLRPVPFLYDRQVSVRVLGLPVSPGRRRFVRRSCSRVIRFPSPVIPQTRLQLELIRRVLHILVQVIPQEPATLSPAVSIEYGEVEDLRIPARAIRRAIPVTLPRLVVTTDSQGQRRAFRERGEFDHPRLKRVFVRRACTARQRDAEVVFRAPERDTDYGGFPR